jgi:hypothetical protein
MYLTNISSIKTWRYAYVGAPTILPNIFAQLYPFGRKDHKNNQK